VTKEEISPTVGTEAASENSVPRFFIVLLFSSERKFEHMYAERVKNWRGMSGIARYTSSIERRTLRSPGRPDHRWGMTEEQALTYPVVQVPICSHERCFCGSNVLCWAYQLGV